MLMAVLTEEGLEVSPSALIIFLQDQAKVLLPERIVPETLTDDVPRPCLDMESAEQLCARSNFL
jgi:hypothetical protein